MKNRIILYNTLIFLILLFILEITFRILGFGYENAPLENDNYLHHKNPTNYSFKCYTPSKEYGGHNIYLDSIGRRTNKNKQINSKNEELWFFGDSFTAAFQVDWQNSFVGILDSITEYNAKNFAVSSYSPLLYYLQLKLHLQNKQKPKKIFIQLYSNDVQGDKMYTKNSNFENNTPIACIGENPNYLIRYLRKFYIMRVLRKAQVTLKYIFSKRKKELRINEHVEFANESNPNSQFYKNILRIKTLLDEQKIEYYFYTIPSKYACISGDWQSINFATSMNIYFETNNIPFIDLNAAFKSHSQNVNLFYNEDIHCNENGNALIANVLMSKLQ